MSTAAQKRAARRRPLKGFPIPFAPMTLKEVREYYSHSKLQCLICGRLRGNLGNHLRIHGVTVDAYKELYGLPWTVGLTGREAFDNYSKTMLIKIEAGHDPSASGEQLHKMQQAARNQRTQPFKREISILNLPKDQR